MEAEKLIVIKTLAELQELERRIEQEEYMAYDTETTGTVRGSQIIGFSLAFDAVTGYYVVLSYWDKEKQRLIDRETKSRAKEIISKLIGKKLIMQNAGFDCEHTQVNFCIELMPYVVHDTMLGGHILNENRSNGLKERGVELFGEDARAEQQAMKESVVANGGVLTKDRYELYKADEDLLGYYGAKDAILTMKVFFHDVPKIYDEGLDSFFYEDESMPLLRGPTYDMNTTGLLVDPEKLQKLRQTLEVECLEALGFINHEVAGYVKDKYPGTGKTNHFNISAPGQRAWLLFERLGEPFNTLTDTGKELCKALQLKLPYSPAAKRAFIQAVKEHKGEIWEEAKYNWKTKKMGRPKKVGDPWTYMQCGKESLEAYAKKYKWVARYLELAKNQKLLSTYVIGIQGKLQYNVIRPSFLQHGTTSGRYSSRNPNFQNLPRDDKRVKACIISRPGKVFVGADYSQLEPRVFASISGDKRLMECFSSGDDFYSVVGAPIFGRDGLSLKKGDKNSFAVRHPEERQIAKEDVALATPYGTTAWTMSRSTGKSVAECEAIISAYFDAFPAVHKMMLESHHQAKTKGYVTNLFGRPRRLPEALEFVQVYGDTPYEELPYPVRNVLNLSMNHRVQSTGASIMNRAAIAVWKEIRRMAIMDTRWEEIKIVLQVHDELVLEGPEALSLAMSSVLKVCMEKTTQLPGVKLIAEPKIAHNLADLK